jgi:hypothetical protein
MRSLIRGELHSITGLNLFEANRKVEAFRIGPNEPYLDSLIARNDESFYQVESIFDMLFTTMCNQTLVESGKLY